MWSMAVCDDNRRQCRELEAALEIYGEENRVAVETEIFYDGFSLAERMEEGKRYDLIFLDVLMEGMDGIQVGDKIRKGMGDEDVQLVYISRALDHAELLFPNRPLGFLKKPFLREDIYRLTDYARKLGFQSHKFFLYRKGRILYQVAYKEIRYFQSSGRKIQIHTAREVHEFYGKLSQILEDGLPGQFIQIHQSYIINTDYVTRQGRDRVFLEGEKGYFSISHPYRASIG